MWVKVVLEVMAMTDEQLVTGTEAVNATPVENAADADQQLLIRGIHTADIYFAAGGQQNGIEMLGQGGFAASVAAQNGYEASLFNA